MGYALTSLDIEPPGGWVYNDPLIPGALIVGSSFDELVERVVHRRHVNNARTVGAEYEIMEQICGRMTTAQRTRFAVQESQLSRTYKQRLRALRALIHPDYVTPERAQERAEICRVCPAKTKNTNPITAAEDKLAVAKIHSDGRLVEGEEDLFNCSVCTCPNAATVHIDVEQAVVGYDEKMWESTPNTCWKMTELGGLLPGSKAAIAAKKALGGCAACAKNRARA